MRRVRATLTLPRAALTCAALLLLASCGTGGDGDGHAPGAPVGVTAAAGSATSVHVMWDAVTASPAVGTYEIYRGTTKVKEVPGSEHMVDVTRLKPATVYAFTVRARDTDGRLGPRSREVKARTPVAVAADHSAPTRPSAPQGRVIGSRAVQLSWGGSKDDRSVVSYDIYQGGTKIHSVGGAQTATVVTGLRPSTRYSFTVRARDAADNLSPASTAVPLTTAPGSDDGRGTAPTDFGATTHRGDDGAYYIDLSWVPPSTDGVVTEYQIYLDGQPATSLVWGGTAPRDRATYSFYVGREAGDSHRVRLRARLPDGTWGGFSAERTVTTGETAP
ncbi:fibronectin type III domain-containing protein [Streptomyces sp. MBT53]|uniref:fibronectin type III domain-containing protein n=1 Tax=Streptomyces sp. MBT53 TaxID=1488384 RepID=UPI0019135BF7|nr:fibronectin type III domain-containing protein [Streptomyces sp. MBT53]MBK6009782.1 fibronectin type III domain-containing protein [Streptomyces sp. MBT53]